MTQSYKIRNFIKLWSQRASHPVCVLTALLCFAGVHKPFPEFGRDAGDVEGAGDGWGVERSQVGSGQRGPPGGLEVNNNQLLFQ